MKKFFMYLLACVFTIGLTSCGGAIGGNDPSSVAKACYDAMLNDDIKGAMDYMHFKMEMTAEDKEQMEGLMQGLWKASGCTGFEITGEEIAEDGQTAKVFMSITEKGKDKPGEKTIKMIQVDGKWMVDSGK